ncbi:winged helix-turn-helix transcriptional regulator [Paenibacillus polymyxa]|uniref:Chemotaxis protein CheY n=1 Tax=Paenibacillus polymyxa TaxID=1406 RepID=A0A378Y7G3_PAEPO|nr:winged helix-turn-helix domain-containing protein [Paenibacillus polymyxa]MBE7899637.1 winged helix-turn-helix transcriptional regulator [Paenibacillus polymyxa]MBG9762218.1 chemotaxis protein CheY [Paenibacillus polymyxa]MCC3258821.1 winged helix-turn-helix domain-containing protein [Paenibacillus polymyxa]QPK52964.1 winged helix-turn-helix transcriptional regulator [Paenibacillus polymyxa]QPK58043.1 winged helix-turn-helix transcriptional regulator [Paenibacillus polymyxa]
MIRLQFDADGYSVVYNADRVMLLAKEFALLRFLYDNRNQVFTREQLLDRVWPLEYPVERTVDDHIYRLRKKLKSWNGLRIHTVRGYGYSLTLTGIQPRNHPSLHDQEVQDAVHGLFRKYHLLGQGDSIVALAEQQEQMGFQMSAYYQMYTRFVQADVAWFLKQEDFAPADRLYWMLLLYTCTAGVTDQGLALCERALASGLLSSDQERELRILNILEAYVENGQPERAQEGLPLTFKVMVRDDLDKFVMPVALMEMYMHLVANHMEKAAELSDRLEGMLSEAPYLRELGRYRLLRGLMLLRTGDVDQAERLMDEGLVTLDMAKQELLKIKAVSQIRSFLKLCGPYPMLEEKYAAQYDQLDRDNSLTLRRSELRCWLEQILFVA